MSRPDSGGRAKEFCALVARASREDPLGTATPFEHYLAIEIPLPWPEALWQSAVPQTLLQAWQRAWEQGTHIRLLALAPDPLYSQPGATRVLHFRRPAGPFATFTSDEYLIPGGEQFQLAEALLTSAAAPEHIADYRRANARDVLVCTHGAVDACCARFGYPLYAELRSRYGSAATGLRVWRTSHFGGHRFAPTLIDLPEGRYWAHLTPEALELLALRNGPVAGLRLFYRGWSGLVTPFEQIAEGEIWLREGWTWLGYHKTGQLLAVDGSPEAAEEATFADEPPRWAEVRIAWRSPDGRVAGAYEARLELCGRARMGGCGGEHPYANQYRLTHLEAVASADTAPAQPEVL